MFRKSSRLVAAAAAAVAAVMVSVSPATSVAATTSCKNLAIQYCLGTLFLEAGTAEAQACVSSVEAECKASGFEGRDPHYCDIFVWCP